MTLVKRLIPSLTEDQIKDFWSKVEYAFDGDATQCWPWSGPEFNKQGYGQIPLRGGCHPAHRVAWFIWNGRQPGRLIIRHECNNPPCCNPNHLLGGTSQDNTDDMKRSGRDNFWGYRTRTQKK